MWHLGMIKSRRWLAQLADERSEIAGQDLQCDVAIQRVVARTIDVPHPAGPQQRQYLVRAESNAGRQIHRRSADDGEIIRDDGDDSCLFARPGGCDRAEQGDSQDTASIIRSRRRCSGRQRTDVWRVARRTGRQSIDRPVREPRPAFSPSGSGGRPCHESARQRSQSQLRTWSRQPEPLPIRLNGLRRGRSFR